MSRTRVSQQNSLVSLAFGRARNRTHLRIRPRLSVESLERRELLSGNTTDFTDPVGYLDRSFEAGPNLFSNPYSHRHPSNNSPTTVSDIFSTYVPDGTSISLWNSTSNRFEQTTTFDALTVLVAMASYGENPHSTRMRSSS